MPTVVIQPGSTIFVTGVNGLVGSHVVDQLLKRGYNVRGAVRDVKKSEWLSTYFDKQYEDVEFSLVEVPDMTVKGCYDAVLQGADGFIHVASPMGRLSDAFEAISTAIDGGINALTACAKTPSVKGLVFTSSSIASTFAKPNVEVSVTEDSFNDEALKAVKENPDIKGLAIYAAVKTETEKYMWNWVNENKPDFVFNTVLPNVNFGRVLVPEHQGFPSTIGLARAAWTGVHLKEYMGHFEPQWFISTTDTALLHISALIYGEVASERLFGFAEPFNCNQILAIFRSLYPDQEFPKDTEGLGVDRMSVPNQRAEEVLKWLKGTGWDSLETALQETSENWVIGHHGSKDPTKL